MGPESVIPALNNTRLQDIISSASLDLFIRTQQLNGLTTRELLILQKKIVGITFINLRAYENQVCC